MAFRHSHRSRGRILFGVLAVVVLWLAALAGPAGATAIASRPALTASLRLADPVSSVDITFLRYICPRYGVVPANRNPTSSDDTGGHGGELGSELNPKVQTSLVDPATDVPSACSPESGEQFTMTAGSPGVDIGTATTGTDGSAVFNLTSPDSNRVTNGIWSSGVVVTERVAPNAGFGALRCYRDINNGDNLEGIFNWNGIDPIICIGYDVVASTAPTPTPIAPTPTPVPTVTPSPAPITPAPTPAPIATLPPTRAPSPTATPTPSPSSTPTPSPSSSPTTSPTAIPTPSPSARPDATPTPSRSATPTPIPAPAATPTPGVTPAPTPIATATPAPTPAPIFTPIVVGAPVAGGPTTPGAGGDGSGGGPDGGGSAGGIAPNGTGAGSPGSDPAGSGVGDAGAGGSADGSPPSLMAGVPGLPSTDPFGQLPRLATLAALMSTTTTLALAFLLFGKKRRDEAPTDSDANLAAASASPYAMLGAELAPAFTGVDPGTGGTDLNLPRWRRPSLLAARKSDPIRNGGDHVALTFNMHDVPSSGGERHVIRYQLVRLLDRPDELLGQAIDSLDEGDEVEILEQRGTYRRVLTPDGRQGWIHRMTIGDIVTNAAPSPAGFGMVDEDVLLAYLDARARA